MYLADPIAVRRLIMDSSKNELIRVVRNSIASSNRRSMGRRTLNAEEPTAMDCTNMKAFLMIDCKNEYSE